MCILINHAESKQAETIEEKQGKSIEGESVQTGQKPQRSIRRGRLSSIEKRQGQEEEG